MKKRRRGVLTHKPPCTEKITPGIPVTQPSHINLVRRHLKKLVYASKQNVRTTSIGWHCCHHNHHYRPLPKSCRILHLYFLHSKGTQYSHPNIWMPLKSASINVNIVIICQKYHSIFSIDIVINNYTFIIHTYVTYIQHNRSQI